MTGENEKTEERERTASYEGTLDDNHMRNGYGVEVHRRKHGNEVYKGNFKNDAYHGFGYYKYDSIFNPKWTYEGAFFANAKEGYGLLSLPDHTHFEGLYERDRPFGPGVLTRADGKQDVGFWQSSSIIRLISTVQCDVDELSTTAANKASLTVFRELVEIAPPKSSVSRIAGEADLIEDSAPKLYSLYCKDPKSFLLNYEEFDRVYFNDLKKIENLVPLLSMDDFSHSSGFEDFLEMEQFGEITYKSMTPTLSVMERTQNWEDQSWERLRKRINLLLAWNNTPVIIDMMVHTFINRIYEKMVGFNVTDLLCNNRQKFGDVGPLEEACVKLLESCHIGDIREFTWLLFVNKLNINLHDNNGNGCVIIAAAQDHHALLYLLFLYGADLNALNDEGFTALTHALTRYLALTNSVANWGQSFLPTTQPGKVNARVWKKCSETSFGTTKLSMKSEAVTSKKRMSSRGHSIDAKRSRYIFDLSPAIKQRDRSPRGRRSIASTTSRQQRSTQEISLAEKQAEEKQNKLLTVYQTMELLLKLRVNPNLSKVPQPAIILALFSGDYDLMKMLLQGGANPNARMLPEEGWLTPLHVLCLAKPQPAYPEIMDLLLEYGADPNAQAAVNFAPATQDFVLNGFYETEFTMIGMTPLQALLLREDASFVQGKEILKELLLRLHNITSREPKYFGHSFLSSAMIRMNLAFIFTLLYIFEADANEELDHHWGNIVTTYLTFLAHKKESEAIITLIELEQAGMNPLRIVEILNNPDNGNAINFALGMLQGPKQTYNPRQTEYNASASSTRETLKSFNRGNSTANTRKSSPMRQTKGPKEKELLKKLTLLQDSGRDKVDKYARGVILRKFIKYLRGINSENKEVNKKDSSVQQAINWFRTEDEFVRTLTHNVLGSLTFFSEKDVDVIFKIFKWGDKEVKFPTKQLPRQKDSLKQTEKILLRQFKEVINNQLAAGVPPDQLHAPRKVFQSVSSQKSRKPRRAMKKSREASPKKHPSMDIPYDSDDENEEMEEEENGEEQLAMRKAAFLEKVRSLLTMCAPQVRWAKRYGTKFLRIPKREKFSKDFFPEVDMDPFLYRVCYKCVKRHPDLQLCPVCKLIYYCSSRCNFRDLMNCNSNHRCKADFYGRGFMWRHYGFDENGDLIRVPREGQEDWEAKDILEDKTLKKYGKKDKTDEGRRKSRGGTQGSERWGRSGQKGSEGKWSRGGGGGKWSQRCGGGSKWGEKGSPGKGSKGELGAGRGKDQRGTKGGRYDPVTGKWIPGKTDKGNGKNARKEQMLLRLKEMKRLRQIRDKMPKGVMGDFMRWGFMTMQSLQEKPWYQKLQDSQMGYGARDATVSDAYMRMLNQLKLLEALASLFGPDFNLQSIFPWVVLRDGELYYKFNSTLFVLENYSFN